MKLTLEQYDTTVSIENDDVDIYDTFHTIIIPALRGIGFHEASIKGAINLLSHEWEKDE